jgi:hypothetical protein
MLRRLIVALYVLIACASLSPIARGQHSERSVPINIQVTDPVGATVEGACITVVGKTENVTFSKETDSLGRLRVGLRPGEYDIVVVAEGFSRSENHLDVMGNSPPSVEIKLTVGATSGLPATTVPRHIVTQCRDNKQGQ